MPSKSPYSVHPSIPYVQNIIAKLKTKTGRTIDEWVEFVQKGTVKGREVVSIVPQAEAKTVAKDAPPPSGGSKVQTLKGNEYVRVWINKAGNYYLIHLPTGAAGN